MFSMQPDPLVSEAQPAPRARERAKFLGVEQLSDHELLALVVSTGSAGRPVTRVAAELIESFGGLVCLGRAGVRRLARQPGIGLGKATRLLAGIELGRRVAQLCAQSGGEGLGCFDDIVRWAGPRLAPLPHEEVWLLCLDGRNALRSARRVAQGGRHGCALTPADVLRPAIEEAASGIALVHNHPSGDPTPSHADIVMTAALEEACRVVGLSLVDHVVVARAGAESVRSFCVGAR